MTSTRALEAVSQKVYTECDMFAAAGVGFLVGSLWGTTVLLLLSKI